jgi:putative flippase GtrA
MGCRDFSHPDVPPRSVAGNRFTAAMFRLCYGIRITDTQTGLRAIPAEFLEAFTRIEGERFEYETNMLLQMKRMCIAFVEQPIETVYDKEEYSSHYNALKDSWRIFKVMAKFLLSSGAAFLIDTAIFYVLMKLFGAKWGAFAPTIALVIARVVSSFVNFNANKSLVFRSKASYKRSMLRYYILCAVQLAVNAALTNGLVALAGRAAGHPISAGLATLIQIVVMTVLFFISYPIQREWVFAEKS